VIRRPQQACRRGSEQPLLAPELLDEARNATVFLAGYPVRLTLTRLVEQALRAELRRLKDTYNRGAEFPPRTEELKGGRPIAA